MRRLWAAGAAIVMLAAVGTGPTLAQGEVVTGTGTFATYPGHVELSDPRVSGDMTMDVDTDLGHVFWGTITIEGPDGDWVGPFTGIWNTDLGKYVGLQTLEGTDAYEGWTFVYTWLDAGGEPAAAVNGRIYEGPAPRMEFPESPAPASE